jgi:ADP-heptose:LPS heptosyltransferase
MADPQRILVLKLGALGNVVLSFGPFAAIRRHHATAHITLLTTSPYADWLARSPWFNSISVDERAEWWDVAARFRLRRRLAQGAFDRVYDLQTSGRSSRYLQLFPATKRPDWSGIAYGCSLPDRDPNRNRLHDVDRQFGQLRQAGIAFPEPIDLSWSQADIDGFGLPPSFALLVPGSSAHRLLKRWPAERYRELANMLVEQGISPVVIGSAPERPLAQTILAGVGGIDLTGRTDFDQIIATARAARVAIGNDTGPMHLIAAAGCPSVVLFSHDSDPALHAPPGAHVSVLRRPDLRQLDAQSVMQKVMQTTSMQSNALVAG